jgi:hypothetical protein
VRAPLAACLLVALAACAGDDGIAPEADRGPIESLLDALTRTVWPGVIGTDGTRRIRHVNGFRDGQLTGYWFAGLAPRFTADVFWFCRDGDVCPRGPDGSVNPGGFTGAPVFARLPGENGYSPFWNLKVVHVPVDYQADSLKSSLGVERAVADGRATVEPLGLIIHCLLVLDGTELERNGRELIGQPGVAALAMAPRTGWHQQYRVTYYDFSVGDGWFAPDPSGVDVTRMPWADTTVLYRDCAGGSQSPVCGLTSGRFPSVSELGVATDLTGDGDLADTNNLIAALPGQPPADPADRPYSPLWAIKVVRVRPEHDAEVRLIDTTGDQAESDLDSVAAMRAAVDAGLVDPPQPMSEAQAGNRVPGNDGEVYFDCPSQVAAP